MTEIRRQNGIDGLVSGYSPGKVEGQKELETIGGFQELLNKYQKNLARGVVGLVELVDFLNTDNKISEILPPADIQSFLQAVRPYRYNRHFSSVTPRLLNQLIQNSYEAGYNDFHLNLYSIMKAVCSEVHGSDSNPICIEIEGYVGNSSVSSVNRATIKVKGDTGPLFGSLARDSTIYIDGNVGQLFANRAERCTFILHGQAELYHVQGPREICSTGCTFKTSNQETYHRLLNDVKGKGNKFMLDEGD